MRIAKDKSLTERDADELAKLGEYIVRVAWCRRRHGAVVVDDDAIDVAVGFELRRSV